MKRIFYAILLLVACNTNSCQNGQVDSAQNGLITGETGETKFPEIGMPIPDFTLTNVEYYKQRELNSADLKGKFVILDFWTRYCKACIYSFPKVDKLRKQYKDRLELFLVTPDSGKFYSGTKEVYEKFRQRHNLDIPISYNNHLPDQFGIKVVPHLIWIDNKGIVQAITTSKDLNSENIEAFLNGEQFDFRENLNEVQVEEIKLKYNSQNPLLINGNGGTETDFLFRSILTEGSVDIDYSSLGCFMPYFGKENIVCQVTNTSLKELYQIAYGDTIKYDPIGTDVYPNCYGKYWYEPLLEAKDTIPFQWDYKTMKNTYCYSLMVPDDRLSNTLENQKIMQRDLKNYFDYNVSVETRKMPYWAIKTTGKAKRNLRTGGGKPSLSGNGLTEMKYVNQSIGNSLIYILWSMNQLGPPFIDETGITENIDIILETDLTDFDALQKELKRNGLLLEEKEKNMKVIVIRDPQS